MLSLFTRASVGFNVISLTWLSRRIGFSSKRQAVAVARLQIDIQPVTVLDKKGINWQGKIYWIKKKIM